MPIKEKLLKRLYSNPLPRNFTKNDLSTLLSQCDCVKGQGGRGSGIRFYHQKTGRILAFDEPHPGNELYPYQVKMARAFIREIGEYEEGNR